MPFCGNFDFDWDMELGKPHEQAPDWWICFGYPVEVEFNLDDLPYWGA